MKSDKTTQPEEKKAKDVSSSPYRPSLDENQRKKKREDKEQVQHPERLGYHGTDDEKNLNPEE